MGNLAKRNGPNRKRNDLFEKRTVPNRKKEEQHKRTATKSNISKKMWDM